MTAMSLWLTKSKGIAEFFSREVLAIKLNKTAAALAAITIISMLNYSSGVFNAAADDEDTEDTETVYHTINFLDFDGEIMTTLTLEEGEEIDYTQIDTEVLHYQLDKFSEIRFDSWDIAPATADDDYNIQALSQVGSIKHVSFPEVTEYITNEGSIDLSGLSVTITLTTELPEYDSDGNRVTNVETVDVTDICYAVPETLSDAFGDGTTAQISVFPLASMIAICNYTITYLKNLGDVVQDGVIDAVDASMILSAYAKTSVGSETGLTDEQENNADVDRNGAVDAIDASLVLNYYARHAIEENPTWAEILNK